MRTFQNLLLLTSCLAVSAFAVHRAHLITPGKHVGPFYLWKTSAEQVEAQFGKGQVSTLTWKSDYSAQVNTYTVVSYPDKGLKFYFFSEAKSQRDFFGQIEVSKECEAVTDKGLSLHSTRAEVSRVYRQLYPMGDTVRRLVFSQAGITFHFKNCSVAQATDTVTSISIYKPKVEFIHFKPKQ